MIREALWSAWDGPRHLRLTVRDSGTVADGLVLGLDEGRPFRLAFPSETCGPMNRNSLLRCHFRPTPSDVSPGASRGD